MGTQVASTARSIFSWIGIIDTPTKMPVFCIIAISSSLATPKAAQLFEAILRLGWSNRFCNWFRILERGMHFFLRRANGNQSSDRHNHETVLFNAGHHAHRHGKRWFGGAF